MGAVGIEREILKPVAWAETGVIWASFAGFFWDLVIRLYRGVKETIL
jgi:hypothetical protein